MMVEERSARRASRSRYYQSPPLPRQRLQIGASETDDATGQSFERMDDSKDPGLLDKLNELVRRYAGGEITNSGPQRTILLTSEFQPAVGKSLSPSTD